MLVYIKDEITLYEPNPSVLYGLSTVRKNIDRPGQIMKPFDLSLSLYAVSGKTLRRKSVNRLA